MRKHKSQLDILPPGWFANLNVLQAEDLKTLRLPDIGFLDITSLQEVNDIQRITLLRAIPTNCSVICIWGGPLRSLTSKDVLSPEFEMARLASWAFICHCFVRSFAFGAKWVSDILSSSAWRHQWCQRLRNRQQPGWRFRHNVPTTTWPNRGSVI